MFRLKFRIDQLQNASIPIHELKLQQIENLTCRTWNGSVGTHETAQFGAVMVRTHEKLALVLVAAWITGRWLSSSCQSLKIKFVRVSFPVYFRHYVFVVVVPKTNRKTE